MHNPDSPVAYLDQASMNRIADKHALDKYLKSLGGNSKDDHNFRFLVNPELKKALRGLISKLGKTDQQILYLRYWDDLCIDEISSALQISEKEVNQRLVEILANLREHILTHVSGKGGRGKGSKRTCQK